MATSSGKSCNSGSGGVLEERRIWIGNLDPRLSEYQLLKILQKCGPVEKFDMLFHKSGPLVGQSRGYAFVTFGTADAALKALEKLNGTPIANRPIVIRLAKNVNYDELNKQKPRIEIPALGSSSRDDKMSREDAIRAIESKLRALERNGEEELELNLLNSASTQVPFIQRYQFNKDRDTSSSTSGGRTYTKSYNSAPYNRHQRPKRR
ncbi:probable RNA-binding protein 18 isoform X1 [Bactrocera neohumeralis]|uniref:probable RNA-binding protein 18 isoform X1 n=1 Tax=Bactrocera tryoni TaxID=59916 RepID=UPI001A998785|nr:probable RNA-binding protein 18 isoform X1 [Bactrocera tryoni]XP_050329103.1 probable RNA-binding protein 18 isoform X1 [Bactrocera neohumeralis]